VNRALSDLDTMSQAPNGGGRKQLLRRRIQRAALVLALLTTLSGASFLSTWGVARAANTVWFYPPSGRWTSHGYPSGSTPFCWNWSHSIATDATRNSSNMYVHYYDVYGGSISRPGSSAIWLSMWLVDGTSASNSQTKWPTGGLLFSQDWTAWFDGSSHPFNHYAYGEVKFTEPDYFYFCASTSNGMYKW
jgi:hypothetical protein